MGSIRSEAEYRFAEVFPSKSREIVIDDWCTLDLRWRLG